METASTTYAALAQEDRAREMVERITNAVRREGGVGLDVDPATDSYWIVQVDEISFAPPQWDDLLYTRVRTAMAWEREQQHPHDLAESVQDKTAVRVDREILQEYIATPHWRG